MSEAEKVATETPAESPETTNPVAAAAEGSAVEAQSAPEGEVQDQDGHPGAPPEEKHEYDLVVCGTGIKECILSSLCSIKGLKVLNVDDNPYYGSDSASLNLEALYEKFRPGQTVPAHYKRPHAWNVDLAPKLLLGSGSLIQMLLQTRVNVYLEFVVVKGSFVFKDGNIEKVPVTPGEALSSGLVGFFQKRRLRNFLQWVNDYDLTSSTPNKDLDARSVTARAAYEYWSLDEETYRFVGHALAGYSEDSYLDRPAIEMVERCKLYANAVAQFNDSPFLYTRYGLGGIPEGFARAAAIHGGTQMLNRRITEVQKDDEGKVCGLTIVDNATGEVINVKTKAVLAEARFFANFASVPNKVIPKERIVRSVNFLTHPIPNTENRDSLQIIIPGASVKRKNDIYVTLLSSKECVCVPGFWVACASTVVEGNVSSDAEAERQLEPAFRLMGPVENRFTYTTIRYVAADDGTKDKIFITSSLDATCTFDNEAQEVIRIYPRISGEPLDLSKKLVPDIADY